MKNNEKHGNQDTNVNESLQKLSNFSNKCSSITDGSNNGIEKGNYFDYSSMSSTYSSNDEYESSETGKAAMKKLLYERDVAHDEAQEAKSALRAVMEVVQILTRQMKCTSSANDDQHKGEDNYLCLPSDLSIDGEDDDYDKEEFSLDFDIDLDDKQTDEDSEQENDLARNIAPDNNSLGNRKRTLSGVSACTIATYTTDDNQRYAEVLKRTSNILQPELSKLGADLIALDGACRAIEQNARLISEDSSIMLQDLRLAHSELIELDDRCCKAERCAKQLYKENKVLQREVVGNKAERKVLVREIKTLMDEKKERELFQQELLDNLKAHENIMIERTNALKNHDDNVLCDPINEKTYKEDLDENASTFKNSDSSSDAIESSQLKSKTFNPFGKFFQSTTATDEASGVVEKPNENARSGMRFPLTPTIKQTVDVSNSTMPISSVSSNVETMLILESPRLNYDTDDSNSCVLQLIPTISTCDSTKSVLSAQDLNPGDAQENGLKPFSKENISWKQRTVNSPPSVGLNASVVTVKMPTRNRKLSALESARLSSIPSAKKVTKTTKKQYRLYTLS